MGKRLEARGRGRRAKEKLENEIRDGGESGMAGHGQGERLFKKAEGGRRKMKNGNADR